MMWAEQIMVRTNEEQVAPNFVWQTQHHLVQDESSYLHTPRLLDIATKNIFSSNKSLFLSINTFSYFKRSHCLGSSARFICQLSNRNERDYSGLRLITSPIRITVLSEQAAGIPQFSLAPSQELASEPYILATEHLPRRRYLSGHEQPLSTKKPLKWQCV